MAGYGLCASQDIDHLDLDRLIMQLTVLEKDAPLQASAPANNRSLSQGAGEPDDCIFSMLGSDI
jgi:hypothetical protein